MWTHPLIAPHTFVSSANGTLSRIDHIPGHKTRPDTFKGIVIPQSVFSGDDGIKLEISNRRKAE